MKGMSVSQAEGGTRSGLLWEVERILTEMKEKPQILLMENVPQVIGTNNIRDFQKWEQKLEELGYQNYIEILNAKDYGIPQNRQRAFMISLHGDYSYYFPKKIQRKYNLADFLEQNVDEKYFLSQKMIDYISSNNDKWTENNKESLINKSVASTINTGEGSRRCDASNYVAPEVESGDVDLKKIVKGGNKEEYIGVYDSKESDTFRPTTESRVHINYPVSKTITCRDDSCCVILGKEKDK